MWNFVQYSYFVQQVFLCDNKLMPHFEFQHLLPTQILDKISDKQQLYSICFLICRDVSTSFLENIYRLKHRKMILFSGRPAVQNAAF